jgi:exodeoxyribonuclease VII large subunit
MSLSGIAAAEKQRLSALRDQLDQLAHAVIATKKQELIALSQLLSAYDPEAALERGYALLKSEKGALIRTVADVSPGETITATLHDGSLEAIVSSTKNKMR